MDDAYEPGDVYTDNNGDKWLKLSNGQWAYIFDDIAEPDTINNKGETH